MRTTWFIALLFVAACTTSSRDGVEKVRVVGENGEELSQVVPLGVAPGKEEGPRPGDRVTAELRRSIPRRWQRAILLIVPHSCTSRCERAYELVIYDPATLSDDDPTLHIELPHATAELYSAVDELLAEWVLSDDQNLRFDAMALISDHNIRSALPSLRLLAERLEEASGPSAPYEWTKVNRLVGKLTRGTEP